MGRNVVTTKEDSQLIKAASAELHALRELAFEMDSILYTEPAPSVHSVAKVLLDVGEIRARLAGLASTLEETQE